MPSAKPPPTSSTPASSPRPDTAELLLRLIGGDPAAPPELLGLATTSADPSVLAAAALLTGNTSYLTRAADRATVVRDRQLVALAAAQLRGADELFDVLVRDHLAAHPDHLLAAWMAYRRLHPTHRK